MATLEHEEQRLFEEALRAALASEEIQAGVRLTTITEGELRARADEAKEEIWQRVQRERQQFHNVSEQVATLEHRLADRRGAAEPRDRLAELRELEEHLRYLLNKFDEDPAYWESGENLVVVRDLLVELSRLLRGELSKRLQSYSEDLPKLVESRDRAIDAVDIVIRSQRAEVETQESERRPNLDHLTQLRADLRGAAAQVRDLLVQLESVLSMLRIESGLGPGGAADSGLWRLRDELIAAREALLEALTYAVLRVLRVMIDERQAAGERQAAKKRLDPEEGELFDRLSPSSREAVSRADGIRLALGQDRIHMEHLVFGLFEKEGGPTQRILREAEIDERKLRELIDTATGMTIPVDYKPAELTALPPVSRHVQDALIAAYKAAGPDLSEPVRSHQLLFGALSITECKLIKLLVELGVNRDSIEFDRRQPSAGGADPASADTRDVLEAALAEAEAEGTPIPATTGSLLSLG